MSDKDFIKIDDLFKGKPEREERIPPGAWRNMQELLEKSATTGGAAGSRRYGLYAVFALLTVGMGVSALSLQHQQLLNKDNRVIAGNNTQELLSATTGTSTITRDTEQTPAAPGNDDTGNQNDAASSSTAILTLSKGNKTATQHAAQPVANSQAKVINGNRSQVAASVTTQNENKANPGTRFNKARLAAAKNTTKQDAVIAAEIQHKSIPNPITSSSPANVGTTAELALAKIDRQQFAPVAAQDAAYEAVVHDKTNNNKFVVEKDQDEWKKEVKIPVTEFTRTVNQKTTADNRLVQQIDTIRQRNYVRTQLVALSDQEKLSLLAIASNAPKVDLNMLGATSASGNSIAGNVTNGAGFANLVPLENYKVKTVNTIERKSFAARFYDMMSTYLNKDKPFYFGASLGGQVMFSQPLQSGFHLGLGGYYEFKERYTLGAELRYLHNSYNNSSLTENYQTYSQQSIDRSGPEPVYNALEQKFTNTYYLQQSTYLELPITMRYQLSKLSVMGGIYGSYMMGTKYTNKMAELSGEATMVSGLKPFAATNGTIVANDFKARYGMGFTLGAAYDFSKNLSLDLRVNQNLWNNLKSTSELSTNLYRSTGVQLSLMYFIGKKDKVIYMMAQ